MDFLLKIVISLFLLIECNCVELELGSKRSCTTFYNAFISAEKDFTYHSLNPHEIGEFCEASIQFYKQLNVDYDILMTANGTVVHDNGIIIPCHSHYVDNNQLGLVNTVYANAKRIWDLGSCSDCYAVDCDFRNNQTACNDSKHTSEFKEKYYKVNECINSNNESKNTTYACIQCAEVYDELNKKYNEIRLKTVDKFCFDIKNMMNKTQIKWSKDLKCCNDRQSSVLEFATLSCITIVVSVLFYIGTFSLTLRKERIQYIPDDLMPPEHSNHHHHQSSRPVMNIHAAGTSISDSPMTNRTILTKTPNLSDDSSSSDDEPLPNIPNIPKIQVQNLLEL